MVVLVLALELETDFLVQCPHDCSNIYNLTPGGIQFSVSTTSKELEITLALVLALALALVLGIELALEIALVLALEIALALALGR